MPSTVPGNVGDTKHFRYASVLQELSWAGVTSKNENTRGWGQVTQMTEVLLAAAAKYIKLQISVSLPSRPLHLLAKPLRFSVEFLRGVSLVLKKNLLMLFYVSILSAIYCPKIF